MLISWRSEFLSGNPGCYADWRTFISVPLWDAVTPEHSMAAYERTENCELDLKSSIQLCQDL